MESDKIICARVECGIAYIPRTHNQKYCGPECCRIETNRRIMQKYYERRDQLSGKARYCDECRITKLSRYNDTRVCASCLTKGQVNSRNELLNMLSTINATAMV